MVNEEAMRKIKELMILYEYRWKKKPNFTIMPPYVTQEQLVKILERVVDTGESILVGWEKLKEGKLR